MKNRTVHKGFASDNNSGIHPLVLEAIHAANTGHVPSYGHDPFTADAVKRFQSLFGGDIDVFFVCNGTAANVLCFRAACRSYHSIITSESAHIHVDECGAPEFHTGCKVLPVSNRHGKLKGEDIRRHLKGFGFEHHAQPRVVSITQSTELGTVYTPQEVQEIAEVAHGHGLLLHMDGARIANACAALNEDPRTVTRDAGVDILSFGGTKNGLMLGEAVIFFDARLAEGFSFIRKQELQLLSKMRFVAAQFSALLAEDLWLELARHANRMARLLAEGTGGIPQVVVTRPVETNAVFATLPAGWIPDLQVRYPFYVWDENTGEVRWMTSFDTEPEDIEGFLDALKALSLPRH
ncbi:MAG: low specificity L-threonine aldolase [Desulfobacterales bacterium]|jgi:threonine aldolase